MLRNGISALIKETSEPSAGGSHFNPWKAEIGRIMAQGQSGEIVPETPISKIPQQNGLGGVGWVVEHLLCKFKA
jgi:hypothetical protein